MGYESEASRLLIGQITAPEDAAAFMEVGREAFGLDAADAVFTPRLLLAARRNGGVAIGAWVDGEPAAFVFGFCGYAADVGFYHYSQVAAVQRRFQGHGVGRRLKYAQADQARALGLRLMRWYFDPMRSRNAHFNLNVLGVVVRSMEPNIFGPELHGRDTGYPSHRLVAEWDLTAGQRKPPVEVATEMATVAVPQDWDDYRTRRGDSAARALLDQTCTDLEKAFSAGLQAVELRRRNAEWSEYVLVRYS
ncbi:GNAT family N-acetyltransferase [Actinoallomurus sp. NPDC052308]|uniref:GNAT family N-acetyltransferase n=1 Tax=Actinoallomurus sp. NPDC052308 TaxID=3155530 RepID=UPI00344A3EDA